MRGEPGGPRGPTNREEHRPGGAPCNWRAEASHLFRSGKGTSPEIGPLRGPLLLVRPIRPAAGRTKFPGFHPKMPRKKILAETRLICGGQPAAFFIE
jgi:hypothetical protein